MSKWEDITDKELMDWFYLAQEMRCSRYIKAIKKEISRRNAE